jgi:hypothetical protein
VTGREIRELLTKGQLEEAIRQLNALEQAATTDDTNSVLISANLERLRLRHQRNAIMAADFDGGKRKLADQIRQLSERLERDLDDRQNNLDSSNPTTQEIKMSPKRSEVVQPSANSDTVREVLLLIHGIRTQAPWFAMVDRVMTVQVPCKVVPIKYGNFDLVRFLLPLGTRELPIRMIKSAIHETKAKYPNARISAIAHSFGAYALMHAIRDPSLELSRIILCGSVLPEKFDVERYFYATEDTGIVNDCGVRDPWPVLAKCFTWGYGASGTCGFGQVAIKDRSFPFSHGEFFHQDFVLKYWVPFVRDGSIVEPDRDASVSSGLSMLSSAIVSLPIRFATSLAVVIGLVSLIWLVLIR